MECVSFCKRNSDLVPKEDREVSPRYQFIKKIAVNSVFSRLFQIMWLSVLDCVLSGENTSEAVKSEPEFKVLVSNLVSSMMGYVDSSVLFQKLFEVKTSINLDQS